MTPAARHILYLGAVLPSRSETFVYREVLGLRDRGVRVSVASVRPPQRGLGDPRLDTLAGEAVVAYGRGWRGVRQLLRGACRLLTAGPVTGWSEVPWRYRLKYLLQWCAGLGLAHHFRHAGITHVHAHMAHVPATVAMACARGLKVPFSFTGHAADLFRDRMALQAKLRAAAFVACISYWHRQFYQSLVTRSSEELPVIRCGVDVEAFQARTESEDRSTFQVLAVGRLVPKKGFDLLLEALPALLENHPQIRLEILGDGPEYEALSRQVEEKRLEAVVRLGGAAANHQVQQAMQQADLFVLPCREDRKGDRDGIPVVLMEAMACGVPVISGDIPTIRELVKDGQTGCMIQPEEVGQLAQTIRRLIESPEERRRLAAAGREQVVEEFSLAVNLDRLESAFQSVHSIRGLSR